MSILLDTHILIWVANGSKALSAVNRQIIDQTAQKNAGIFISAISIWEVGVLQKKKRINLNCPYVEWIHQAIEHLKVIVLPLTGDICVESNELPGDFHADPADRFIVATARTRDLVLITQDRAMLGYGKTGYFKTV